MEGTGLSGSSALWVFSPPRHSLSARFRLAIGRKWILLTDGFVEARDASGTQFGAGALAEALSRSADEQSDPLSVLEESWRQFSENGPDRDDATALLRYRFFPAASSDDRMRNFSGENS